MLALTGNTAPYMLYAYVRIKGIQRKAAESLDAVETGSSSGEVNIILQEIEEVALAKHIMRFEEILKEIEQDLYPNKVVYFECL
jgi:arginyl-tRNA synthetase